MNNYNTFFSFILRRKNSIYYRILCLAYAVFFVIIHDNYFSGWVYITVMFLYFVTYLSLVTLYRHSSDTIRLLLDYTFITLIILGQNPNNLTALVFILLPIFNAINFTGKKRNPILLFSCALISYVTASSFFKFNYFNISSVILGFGSLFIIDIYSSSRWKANLFSQTLLDLVDKYYLVIDKPHKIFKEAVRRINEYLKINIIQDIYCFEKEKDSFKILTSSNFIFNFVLGLTDKNNTKLNDELLVENVKFEYDGKESKYNMAYLATCSSSFADNPKQYLFIVTLFAPLPLSLIGYDYLLVPFFRRIAKFLLSESVLKELRRKTMLDIRNKARFVEQSVRTMHFLRNSLSAYKNLTQQIDAKQSCKSEEMRRKIDSLIIKNNKCAKNELEKITKRADFLLEKDKNPFEIEELKPYSFIDIFTELRNVWNESFSDEIIEIENIDVERCEKYKINSNFEGLDILFSDWISNMSKYKNDCVWCNVSVKENNLIIKFENDYTCTEDKITQLISDLNEDDRRLITRRTTHGIYLIKKAITELNINHKAYKAKREECGDTIVLALTLEMKKNEDYE